MSFLVKVCGITTPGDAALVAGCGADAIGLNFWSGSRRYLDPRRAAEVIRAVPGSVLKVGVFVDSPPRQVADIASEMGIDRVQLHGAEKPEDYAGIEGYRLIRAIRAADRRSLEEAYAWKVGLYLYDAFVAGFGGSGSRAPWEAIAAAGRHPFLLAGGLDAGNVGEAIRATRPEGVDVASGVESSPGVKDPGKVKAFVEAARAAAAALPGSKAR